MPEQTILIIRHAEKPTSGETFGIDEKGMPDPRSLTARGWQRVGAWTELFAPSLSPAGPLPRPTAIFASADVRDAGPGGALGAKSHRTEDTVAPLAAKLGLTINLSLTKGQEAELAQTASERDGITLICWQHETISAIAHALRSDDPAIPTHWPQSVYNVIFRLHRIERAAPWSFSQIAPVMLSGDSPNGIGPG